MADAPPVAVIAPPASAGSSRPILFRGGGSHDDDPEDSVVSWSWKASAPPGTTGCEPLPADGSAVDFTVVFPCAGEHAVSLTVRDSLGLESAASLLLRVEPTLDPPTVTTGADVAVEHRCGGSPIGCTTWDGSTAEVPLAASAEGPPGVSFTYRWTVESPPELEGQPRPHVTFLPSEAAAEPLVRIETAGTAISGRYAFVVSATDSRGMVAVGRQRVEVGNRPPVLVGGGRLLLPHGYEAGTRRFVATGDTPAATWSDPDGDPVVPVGFAAIRSNDGGNVFDVQPLGDHARVTVVVPYGQPADAALLIGPGVSRRVELIVADVNGARASIGWDVEVTNRPPRLVAVVPTTSVDHTFESSFQRYAAQAPLSGWVDDDGDPLLLSTDGDAACGEVVERQGTAWVTCSTPFTGRPDPGQLVGTHAFLLSAADPFAAGPSQPTRLEIRNRPPRLVAPALSLPVQCRPVPGCCELGAAKGTCDVREFSYLPSATAAELVIDDDGDPLDLVAAPAGGCLAATPVAQPCTGAACSPVLGLCGDLSACGTWSPGGTLSVTAGDGLAAVAGDLDVTGSCRP